MRSFISIAGMGSLVQCLSLLLFVGLARGAGATATWPISAGVFFLGTVGTVRVASSTMSFYRLVVVSVTVAFVFLLFYQVIGFLAYPGLVKDAEFLSLEHVTRTLLVLILASGFNVLLAGLCLFVRRFSGSSRHPT